MTARLIDVLILGSGPAGSALSLALKRAGTGDVLMMKSSPGPYFALAKPQHPAWVRCSLASASMNGWRGAAIAPVTAIAACGAAKIPR